MPSFRRSFAATVAAAGLFVSTAASAANPASALSVVPATARASASNHGTSKIGASVSTATLISIGILAAFVAVVLATTGDKNDSKPASP